MDLKKTYSPTPNPSHHDRFERESRARVGAAEEGRECGSTLTIQTLRIHTLSVRALFYTLPALTLPTHTGRTGSSG